MRTEQERFDAAERRFYIALVCFFVVLAVFVVTVIVTGGPV